MAGGSVGTIFAELDLDASRYTKAQQKLLQDATHTTLNIEQNFKNLGVKSSAEMDLMRAKITNSFAAIANSSKATANDIIRAEQAKNEQLKRLDEQQFGRQTSMIDNLKAHWIAYGAVALAAMKAWNMAKVGADFEEQRGILDNLSKKYGTTADSIISDMDRASGYQIAKVDLMKTSLGGLAKGLDPKQMTNLADAALILGDAVGVDAKTALDDLTSALETGRTKGLKNYLGTALDLETAFGDLSSKLTAAEKANAMYNITMAATADLQAQQTKKVDEAADKLTEIEKKFNDVTLAASKFAKSMVVTASDDVFSPLERLKKNIEGLGNAVGATVKGKTVEQFTEDERRAKTADPDELEQGRSIRRQIADENIALIEKQAQAREDAEKATKTAATAAAKAEEARRNAIFKAHEDEQAAIKDDNIAYAKAHEQRTAGDVKYWEESKKLSTDGALAALQATLDAGNASELARAEAFDKEQQANEAKLKATRDIYEDIRGEEQAYYQASLNLIDQQAAEFKKAQVDEVAIAVWKANELDKLNQKMAMSSDSLADGIKAGYKDLEKDQIRWGKVGYDTFKATHQGMARTFSDVFEDSYKGDLKSVGDYAGSIWDSTRRKFFDMAGQMAAEQVILYFKTDWIAGGEKVLGIINSVLGIAGDLFGGSPGVSGGDLDDIPITGLAAGGPLPAGAPVWVGEKGPELLFPDRPGYVMDHNKSLAYAAANGGHIPGFAAGGPILPGVMSIEQVYEFIRALGWENNINTGQWIDSTGMAPLPMRFMTQWGSITPVEAPLIFDPTEIVPAAGVRAMETRPDVGYISHDTGTQMPLVAQIIDAALSIAVPAWGIVSGAAKFGMGAGTGNNSQMIAGIIQAGMSGYAATQIGAGGYAAAGTDAAGVGMGGAGEAATWFTARQALIAAASPVVKSTLANQAMGMIAKAFGGASPSANVEYAGYKDDGMLAMLSDGLHGIAPQSYRIPSYDVGTNYVPRTGLALVHKGEKITPAGQNGDNSEALYQIAKNTARMLKILDRFENFTETDGLPVQVMS